MTGESKQAPEKDAGPVDSGKAATEEKLQDPATFEAYDQAMGDLGDAGGAPSIGGPAA
jgi:hypothetical protein